MSLNREELIDYMQNELGLDPEDTNDDAPLFTSGTLDSFSMIDLVMFLEKRGGFRLTPGEVNLDNLDSMDRILAFYQSKSEASQV